MTSLLCSRALKQDESEHHDRSAADEADKDLSFSICCRKYNLRPSAKPRTTKVMTTPILVKQTRTCHFVGVLLSCRSLYAIALCSFPAQPSRVVRSKTRLFLRCLLGIRGRSGGHVILPLYALFLYSPICMHVCMFVCMCVCV